MTKQGFTLMSDQGFTLCAECRNLVTQCTCLPAGATCVDCRHFNRCAGLFQCEEGRRVCDFIPIKFDWKDPRRAVRVLDVQEVLPR